MFVRVRPQIALHDSGYRVEVRSRDKLALVWPDGSEAIADVEFGPVSTIYRNTLMKYAADGTPMLPASVEADQICDDLLLGVRFLGGRWELTAYP